MSHTKYIFSFVFLLVFSCTAHYDPYFRSIVNKGPEISLNVVHSETGPEVEAVLTKAYGDDFNCDDLEKMVDSALEKYPFNGDLHEVAAFLSLLNSDNSGYLIHLIKAASDLSSLNTETYLRIAGSIHQTYHESILFTKLLEELVLKHSDVRVVSLARSFLAEKMILSGNIEKAVKIVEKSGAIEKWKIIGAFDNDNGKGFFHQYPPEQEIDLSKSYRGKVSDVSWREIQGVDRLGRVPLGNFLYPYIDTAAYMYTSVNIAEKKEVLLHISTGDSIKIWLNGNEIAALDDIEYFSYGNIAVNITLEEGNNALLIKSARRDGDWNIGVSILQKDGKAVPDIDFSFDTGFKIGSENKASVIFPVKKNSDHSHTFRSNILQGLLLEKSGYPKYARDHFLKAFEKKPMNLLSKLFTAETYLHSREDGKYIDILNLAILKTNSSVPAFLVRRGEFYAVKNQQERAEEDFKKVLELNPGSMRGYLNLTKLYRSKNWHEDSRRTIHAALDLWSDSTLLLLEMATSLERLGYIDEASVYYNRAARLFPGNSELHIRATDFDRKKNDPYSALKWGEKAFHYDPFNRTIYFRLYELSRQLKQFNKAFDYLDMIESFSPENALLHRRRGDLYYELLQPEKALESWEKAHLLDPGDQYLSERIAFLKVEEKDITMSFLPGEEQILEAVRKALDFKPHEGAESLLVYDHAACRINSDGSSRWVITEVSRALNDTGRDNLINIFLPYGGRKKIINAYSLDHELKKSEASSVSSYDVRFRQLKTGDFIVVQYIHYNPAPLYLENNFVGQWFIRSPYQHVMFSQWNLIYPKNKKLSIDVASDRVEESKKEIGNGLVSHTFTAKDIEPLIHEYYSPPINDYLDTISVSTVRSWDQYVSWERALLRDAFVRTAEIRKKNAEITAGSNTVMEKIESVFAFVAQEIRYQMEYENVIAGVKPHTAAQTLERGYGDCKDKAVLFIQLLEESGIKARYAVIRTTDAGRLLEKIPGQQFNHAIVYIPQQEGIEKGFFMDPTVDLLEIGNLRSDNQGAKALVLDRETGEHEFKDVPYQAPEYNFQKHERTLRFDDSRRLIVEDSITLRGSLSSMLRQVLRTKEVAYNMFQNLASALYKGGVLKKYENTDINDIRNPLTVTITADVNSLKTEQNRKMTISLPDQIVNPDIVSLENRKLPLSTGIPNIYEVNTRFVVPEGMTVESIPQSIDVKGDCFQIDRKAHFDDKNNTVHVRFSFYKECTLISESGYPDFREKMLGIIKAQNALIVLSTE